MSHMFFETIFSADLKKPILKKKFFKNNHVNYVHFIYYKLCLSLNYKFRYCILKEKYFLNCIFIIITAVGTSERNSEQGPHRNLPTK